MLRTAKVALTPDFLGETKGGLLLVFDENKRTTHLGWIEEITTATGLIKVAASPSVKQNHGESDWECLEKFVYDITGLDSFTALPHCGGFHCSDSRMAQPTFKIYPASSIPTDCVREHASLIEYGNVMR